MIALLAAALMVTAAPSPAAGVTRDPLSQALYQQLAHGLPPAAVGQWVTYTLHGTGRPTDAYWRLAVVGKQKDVKGRDAVWVEMELSQHPSFVAPLFQMKMLVASKGGLQADGITRAILAIGAGKPQEVDPASLANTHKTLPVPEHPVMPAPYRFRAGKTATLMTPAGTVKALPVELVYRQTVIQRYWVSKEIPVLQLAKIEIPALEDSMVVRDYGLDAKPMIHFPDSNAEMISLDPGTDSKGGSDAQAAP